MKKIMTYKKCLGRLAPIAAAALVLLTANSCRRDLWVFQDNYQQVEVDVDWRNYFREWGIVGVNGTQPANPAITPAKDPDGMTYWFFPRDGRKSFRYTTSEVRHFSVYLSQGEYDGLAIDYSPEEYGKQKFIGMDYAATAKVESVPSSYQPDSIPELFGDQAYANGANPLTKKNNYGMNEVAAEPELMASDTIHMDIISGKYDRYIPYKERDTYQSSLVKQLYNMEPLITPWDMRVRIYIKGIYYLWKAQGSIAGLADGYKLVECKASDTPCLMSLDEWEIHLLKDSNEVAGGLGYIAKTFRTWGPMGYENRNWDVHVPQRPEGAVKYEGSIPLAPYSYECIPNRNPNEIRVNLKCLLRDRETVRYYHFDVGSEVYVFRHEYAMRIDLMDDDNRIPDLPYVPAYNGIQFDGVVVPFDETIQGGVVF